MTMVDAQKRTAAPTHLRPERPSSRAKRGMSASTSLAVLRYRSSGIRYPVSGNRQPATGTRSKPARRHPNSLQLLFGPREHSLGIPAVLHHLAVDPRLVIEVQPQTRQELQAQV